MTNRRSFKVVLLGNSGVGKTSIIEQFINNKFDLHENVCLSVTQPTIGIDFLGKTIVHKGMQCRMQLWDSAGQ
jgi:small GTP-binding protein